METVWRGRNVTDDALNRCIKDLRHLLGDRKQPHRYIETFPKRGYGSISRLDSTRSISGRMPSSLEMARDSDIKFSSLCKDQ